MRLNDSGEDIEPSTSALQRLLLRLREPLFDRSIALVACSPYIVLFYRKLQAAELHLTTLVLLTHMLLWIGMMSFRRSPVRVTANPWYWALAFLATYWPFLVVEFPDTGRALTPNWISSGLSLFSGLLMIYARLSLGRNIGIVPAQRKLVMHGAYRYMRHPIYTALLISLLAQLLHYFSAVNLALAGTGGALFAFKGFIEEHFLADDPQYRQYMRDVRWRWIPGLF